MSTTPSPDPETANSLWGRSKKLLPFLQRGEQRSKELDDSRSKKQVPETAKAAHARRREQVRRAQRNHRERKEKYIKTLEQELHRFQDEEMSITHGSLEAREENEILRDIMIAHGIPLPEQYQPKTSAMTSVSVVGRPGEGQRLTVQMPSAQPQGPPLRSLNRAHGPEKLQISSERQGNAFFSPHSTSTQGLSPQNTHPHGLDSTQVGIDFVLSLEQPCLGHTRPTPGSEDPSGHAMTCQAPLLAHAPPVLDTNSKWEIPTIELERLFEFALALNLEGEVTPIQAWGRIKNHPGFSSLSYERLQQLSAVLLEEVQCFGFGATIDEATFNALLNQLTSSTVPNRP